MRPERRWSFLWLLPLAATLFVAWLGWRTWNERGIQITIEFADGHGLKVGDQVRYRGIAVGDVRAIDLDPGAESLLVRVSLQQDAADLVRTGARFWIVRPRLGWEGAAGLETMLGPRYIAALPGSGEARRDRFVGLELPPLVENRRPGDLEIMLDARQRGTLAPGAPVLYRQVPIGTVLSVRLASDGGGVEARLQIREPYTGLIREGTRFWDAGGYSAQLGWRGLSVEVESLRTLLSGGVALATPAPAHAGAPVRTGHRFIIEPQAPDGWLDWQPAVSIGSTFLPGRAALPTPMRARLVWKQTRFLVMVDQRARDGWVLPLESGLLGPTDLLMPDERAHVDTVVLEVGGESVALGAAPIWQEEALALIDAQMNGPAWPLVRCRTPTDPEDCVIVTDPSLAPQPISAARLEAAEDGWIIDPAMPIEPSWHGAAVVARADGRLIGLLLVERDRTRVGLLRKWPN